MVVVVVVVVGTDATEVMIVGAKFELLIVVGTIRVGVENESPVKLGTSGIDMFRRTLSSGVSIGSDALWKCTCTLNQ